MWSFQIQYILSKEWPDNWKKVNQSDNFQSFFPFEILFISDSMDNFYLDLIDKQILVVSSCSIIFKLLITYFVRDKIVHTFTKKNSMKEKYK